MNNPETPREPRPPAGLTHIPTRKSLETLAEIKP